MTRYTQTGNETCRFKGCENLTCGENLGSDLFCDEHAPRPATCNAPDLCPDCDCPHKCDDCNEYLTEREIRADYAAPDAVLCAACYLEQKERAS